MKKQVKSNDKKDPFDVIANTIANDIFNTKTLNIMEKIHERLRTIWKRKAPTRRRRRR